MSSRLSINTEKQCSPSKDERYVNSYGITNQRNQIVKTIARQYFKFEGSYYVAVILSRDSPSVMHFMAG